MAGATPQIPATGAPGFEVERFEWTAPDRLEVSGRWFGVRGRRFVRPTLDVHGAGDQRRLLAVLDHKPWAAEDGQRWHAAFRWEGGEVDLSGAELAVAPGIAVPLDRPVQARRFERRAEPQEPAPAPPPPVPTAAEQAGETLEAAMATADAALRDRRGLERERDAAIRARDAALADRETIIRERFTAVKERDEARHRLAALTSEQDALRADLDAARAEADTLRAEHAALTGGSDEVASLTARLESALRDRDAVRRERNELLTSRDTALAVHADATAELVALREELEEARSQAPADSGATQAFDMVGHVEDTDVREELEQALAELAAARRQRDAAVEERDAAVRARIAITETAPTQAPPEKRPDAIAGDTGRPVAPPESGPATGLQARRAARMAKRAAGERPEPDVGPNEIELLLARVLAGGALLTGIVLLVLFLGAVI